jgi:ABC-2 type transport system ATP-binding protein
MSETTTNDAPPSPSVADPIIAAKKLTKRFGDQLAVDDLTLEIPPGTIFGFIGPSGSGKTTTVRLLTGVQSPTSGEVTVFGVAPSAFSERERARIGYMPQLSVLFPHLSIMENLRFVASIYGMRWGRRKRLDEALEFVELQDDRRKRLRHASGGMQRRLALAAALVNDPQLLFLDEPTTGIDPVLRRKFWDHFESLRNDGCTLFVTTQYVGEAAYCDKIGVLRRGRLLTVDTPEGLRRQAFGGEVIDLIVADRIQQELITDVALLDYVVHAQRTRVDGRGMRVTVEDADPVIPRLQQWLVERGVRIESVDRYLPPFDDVFVNLVQSGGNNELEGLSAARVEVVDPARPATTTAPPGPPTVDASPTTPAADTPPAETSPPSDAPPATPAAQTPPAGTSSPTDTAKTSPSDDAPPTTPPPDTPPPEAPPPSESPRTTATETTGDAHADPDQRKSDTQ